MPRSPFVVLAACCLALTTPGCAQEVAWPAVERSIARAFPSVRHITTDSLARRLTIAAPRPVLLDTRTAEEYAVSHLPGAVRFDPDAPVAPLRDSLDTATPIVVYCSVGYRSAAVAERLKEAGFSDVVNLRGSIFAWANEGRPVVHEGRRVRQVHPYDALWGRLLDAPLRAPIPD